MAASIVPSRFPTRSTLRASRLSMTPVMLRLELQKKSGKQAQANQGQCRFGQAAEPEPTGIERNRQDGVSLIAPRQSSLPGVHSVRSPRCTLLRVNALSNFQRLITGLIYDQAYPHPGDARLLWLLQANSGWFESVKDDICMAMRWDKFTLKSQEAIQNGQVRWQTRMDSQKCCHCSPVGWPWWKTRKALSFRCCRRSACRQINYWPVRRPGHRRPSKSDRRRLRGGPLCGDAEGA